MQKGFLENKQNSIPARTERKDLTSRLFMLGKGACCTANRRDESCREKKEADPYGQMEDSPQCSELEAQPNASLDTAPRWPMGGPLTPLSLTCLQHRWWFYKVGCEYNHILHTPEIPAIWKQQHSDTFGGWQNLLAVVEQWFCISYIWFDYKDCLLTYSRVPGFQARGHGQTRVEGDDNYHLAWSARLI